MKNNILILIFTLFSFAFAETINFESLPQGSVYSPFIVGDFSFSTTDAATELSITQDTVNGSTDNVLQVFKANAENVDVELTRTDNADFILESFDFSVIPGQLSLTGFLDGNTVFSQSFNSENSGNLSIQVDRVVFQSFTPVASSDTNIGGNAADQFLLLDEIVVNPVSANAVPEPSSLLFMIFASGLIVYRYKKRSK